MKLCRKGIVPQIRAVVKGFGGIFKFGFVGEFFWRCRILGSLREGAPAKRVEESCGTKDSGEKIAVFPDMQK